MSRLYNVLGVSPDATEKEITKAFRAKARKLHPDKQPPGASNAEKQKACKAFQELVGAYEVLSDETKRRRHDLERPAASAPAAAARPRQERQRPQQARRQASEENDEASTPRAPPRPSARARQYASEEEEPKPFQAPKPPRKSQQQEEDDKDVRRRREQRERDKRFEGLGSHWVKPPPQTQTSRTRRSSDAARSRQSPAEEGKRKQKNKNGKRSESDGGETDCSSDASSVLSFDIWIDLSKFQFTFETDDDEVNPLDNTEIWTRTRPDASKKETWAPVNSPAEEDDRKTLQDAPATRQPTNAPTKRCCVVQ